MTTLLRSFHREM